LISAAAVTVAALIGIVPTLLEGSGTNENVQRATPEPGPTPASEPTELPAADVGRIAGTLTYRNGDPMAGMSVSIRNGPQAKSDSQGKFVMNDVPAGDRTLEVRTPSLKGEVTQNIRVEPGETTSVKVVHDPVTSRLGLLSITAPVDGSLLELRKEGDRYRASIFGRCDGLDQILGSFDIWVLISSESDSTYWAQRPALVDLSDSTWRATALFGAPEQPPKNDEHWNIVAVAASSGSGMERVMNTPRLNLLPPHISSNTVGVQTKLK
jgi:hypothetical protein